MSDNYQYLNGNTWATDELNEKSKIRNLTYQSVLQTVTKEDHKWQ